jgi:hypothetical protein
MLPEQPSLAQATPARRKNRQIGHQGLDACLLRFLTAGHRPELSKVDWHGTVGPVRQDAALCSRRLRAASQTTSG